MKINLKPLALVFTVKNLKDAAGTANGPVVRILNKYTGDEGLLAHELEHVSQFWSVSFISLIVFSLIAYILGWLEPFRWDVLFNIVAASISVHSLGYLFYRPYRYWCEVEAYRVQLKYSTDKERDGKLFASFIAGSYKLKTTEEEASNRLKL